MSSHQPSSPSADTLHNPTPKLLPTVQITPSTPLPRGRYPSRYPAHLSHGDPNRVPLHRRGRSRTYEALEDLLKEAGYKETRVFTPESERAEARAEERRSRAGSIRGGVDAVVGFLAGWMAGAVKSDGSTDGQTAPSSVEDDTVTDNPQISMPASPLAHKHPGTPDSLHSLPIPSKASSARYSSASPRSRLHQLQEHSLPHPTRQILQHQPSATSSLRAYAQVSAARASLRHMASAPNIPKQARSIRTSLLSDRTNHTHPGYSDHCQALAPPQTLTGYLQRAQTAPNEVTTVRVVCRSTPASRSSSRTGDRFSHHGRGTTSLRRTGSARRNSKLKGKERDHVPSLADTQLENDVWDMQWLNGKRLSLSTSPSKSRDTEYADADTDTDEEDEIDLARLLVPPRRQNSIRSLRRHLHRTESARALQMEANRALDSWADDDDQNAFTKASKAVRTRGADAEEEGTEYGYEAMGLSGVENVGGKRRRGIPSVWAQIAGGR